MARGHDARLRTLEDRARLRLRGNVYTFIKISLMATRFYMIYPEELERALASFVDWYNNERYHESLQNLKPVDMYEGRMREILTKRERIKRRTLRQRKQCNLRRKDPQQRSKLHLCNQPNVSKKI